MVKSRNGNARQLMFDSPAKFDHISYDFIFKERRCVQAQMFALPSRPSPLPELSGGSEARQISVKEMSEDRKSG